ncbi:hypothetical protein BD414DRAFT_493803 [Trametes punicea]|nr:hypothetical protein BD414DRAFT_493803 [Trametes punicea]
MEGAMGRILHISLCFRLRQLISFRLSAPALSGIWESFICQRLIDEDKLRPYHRFRCPSHGRRNLERKVEADTNRHLAGGVDPDSVHLDQASGTAPKEPTLTTSGMAVCSAKIQGLSCKRMPSMWVSGPPATDFDVVPNQIDHPCGRSPGEVIGRASWGYEWVALGKHIPDSPYTPG